MMHPDMTPLIQGYQKFYVRHFCTQPSAFGRLVQQGQRPKFLVIACSDSRVDPAIMLHCQPGDLFVIRNVANLVPPHEEDGSYHGTSAALEFGVCVLEIRHVILLGHTQCGGIQTLLRPSDIPGSTGFLKKWMDITKVTPQDVSRGQSLENPSLEEVIPCGQNSLKNSLNNLHTFPWIAQRVQTGDLFLHAWNFHMATGMLEAYDQKAERFRPIGGQISHQQNAKKRYGIP